MRIRKNKYGAKRVQFDGHNFHSIAEANRYAKLLLLQNKGVIDRLELQPKYDIRINGEKICSYSADFKYLDRVTMNYVVEDVKGVLTPVYKLKKKLVKALYGIDIVEVRA